MKIQIVHSRNPDYECGMTVFVDGVRVPEAEVGVEDIDPGRGWQRSDWNDRLYEAIQDAEDGPSEYHEAVVEALRSESNSSHIVDDGSRDVSEMEEPTKCINADGDDDECYMYFDATSGDGYAGRCPHCADASEPPEDAD
jgi:hypothetical protein